MYRRILSVVQTISWGDFSYDGPQTLHNQIGTTGSILNPLSRYDKIRDKVLIACNHGGRI